MSRLSIELTAEQHKQIKTMATLRGQTIKQYVVERILPTEDITDDEKAAMSELKELLTKRIERAEATNQTAKTIDQVTVDYLKQQ